MYEQQRYHGNCGESKEMTKESRLKKISFFKKKFSNDLNNIETDSDELDEKNDNSTEDVTERYSAASVPISADTTSLNNDTNNLDNKTPFFNYSNYNRDFLIDTMGSIDLNDVEESKKLQFCLYNFILCGSSEDIDYLYGFLNQNIDRDIARYCLGIMYLIGAGIDADSEKAYDLIKVSIVNPELYIAIGTLDTSIQNSDYIDYGLSGFIYKINSLHVEFYYENDKVLKIKKLEEILEFGKGHDRNRRMAIINMICSELFRYKDIKLNSKFLEYIRHYPEYNKEMSYSILFAYHKKGLQFNFTDIAAILSNAERSFIDCYEKNNITFELMVTNPTMTSFLITKLYDSEYAARLARTDPGYLLINSIAKFD